MMVDGRSRKSRGDEDLACEIDTHSATYHHTSPSTLALALTPQTAAKVVPLFNERASSDPDLLPTLVVDWPSTLQRIRDAGAQVRRERDLAQDIVKQSRSLIQRSEMRVEEAEKRAATAEADASEASLRADRAEERLRLAEERAQRAEDRAQMARAGEEEAQLWLRRLYACLRREFDGLGDGAC